MKRTYQIVNTYTISFEEDDVREAFRLSGVTADFDTMYEHLTLWMQAQSDLGDNELDVNNNPYVFENANPDDGTDLEFDLTESLYFDGGITDQEVTRL